MSELETKLGQIATVINQIDDPKVPRNIRKGAKDACEQWLLNKAKEMDVRIAITQAKLEELYEDCLLYTSPSPRDGLLSRMPSSA